MLKGYTPLLSSSWIGRIWVTTKDSLLFALVLVETAQNVDVFFILMKGNYGGASVQIFQEKCMKKLDVT